MVAAEKYLTYGADVREMLDINENGAADIVGPDFNGELWEAVEADYDGEKTKVGFAPLSVTNQVRRIYDQEEITA